MAVAFLAAGCLAPEPETSAEGGGPGAGDAVSDAADQAASELPEPSVPSIHQRVDRLPPAMLRFAGAAGEVDAHVRVAASASERRRGLQQVESLPDDTGMVFVFPAPRTGGFWMRDTLVALQIAFLDADGVVLALMEMEPCEKDPCPVYDPQVTYRLAVEMPAGWFDANGVGEGDRVVAVRGDVGWDP